MIGEHLDIEVKILPIFPVLFTITQQHATSFAHVTTPADKHAVSWHGCLS